jgi:hypothetical protein
MDTATNTTTVQQWAIVELMGHNRYGGLVSTDTQFGTPLLRVDVPMPDGSTVSQLINPASIYRLTMCSEDLARHAAKLGTPRPLESWEMPVAKLQAELPGNSDEVLSECEHCDASLPHSETHECPACGRVLCPECVCDCRD